MRRLLAAVVAAATISATGCGGSHVTLLSVDSPEPESAVLRVRFRMTEKMLRRADECLVVAEFAGHRAEAKVPGGDQDFTRMSVEIHRWRPSAEAVDLQDRVRVSFLLGRKALESDLFAPPFPARVLAMDEPPPERRQTDQRRPDAQPRRDPPSTAQTELLQPDAPRASPPAAPAPCPVCTEPRGDVSPCPACGIE